MERKEKIMSDPFEYLLEKMNEDYGKPKEERRNDKILEDAARILSISDKIKKENKNEE